MNNMIKATALMLSMALISSFAGCSGSNTASESSESTVESVQSSIESSIENESSEAASSEPESSAEVVSDESSVNSNSSAIDPAVEERSYDEQEKYKPQATKIPDYDYFPFSNDYGYVGNESKVTIPSEFTTCPFFKENTSVKEIIVPENITKIPASAFGGCANLEKLVILNPDCEIDGGILPEADPDNKYMSHNNKLVNIYCYFRSDKTVPKVRLTGVEGSSKVFNKVGGYYMGKDFENYIHDLATESYE